MGLVRGKCAALAAVEATLPHGVSSGECSALTAVEARLPHGVRSAGNTRLPLSYRATLPGAGSVWCGGNDRHSLP